MDGKPNVYRDAVHQLYSSLKVVSIPELISYGAGGKVVKEVTDTSQCFAISGDYFSPIHECIESWISDYNKVVKSI